MGLPPAVYQLCTVPCSSFVSKVIPTCGLMNANFVTVPVMVTRRSLSEMALEWCAKSELDNIRTPAVRPRKTINLVFIASSRLSMLRAVLHVLIRRWSDVCQTAEKQLKTVDSL